MAIGTVSTGKTLGELALDVARAFNLAELVDDAGNSITPRLPSDPSRIDTLLDACRSGYQSFVRALPRWNWMRLLTEITCDPTGSGFQCVAGDPGRYALSAGARSAVPVWTLLPASGTQDAAHTLLSVSPERVAAAWAQQTAPGIPTVCAMRPTMQPDGSVRWELMVAPKPEKAYVLTSTYVIQPPDLTDVEDRHMAGAVHDEAIKAACLFEFATRDNGERTEMYRAMRAEQFAASIAIDNAMTPPSLGVIPDTVEQQPMSVRDWRMRTWTLTTYGD